MPHPAGPVRNLILILLLGAAAAASWYFSLPEPQEERRESNPGGAPVGYYLSGASILGTDENGRVAYSLVAQRLEEHPNEDRLLFVGVQIDYRPADTTPWRITAATGSAPKNRALVDLAGDVELKSQPQSGQPIRIATQKLTFVPATAIATTDDPVTLAIGHWQFDAVGLRTQLKDQSLRLESKVHGKLGP
jgi:LPS export ABC transporter protein LptC